jgi:hypothetical protein
MQMRATTVIERDLSLGLGFEQKIIMMTGGGVCVDKLLHTYRVYASWYINTQLVTD